MSKTKKNSTLIAMLASAMMSDPTIHDMLLGSGSIGVGREPKQPKDPNSPESQAKLAKAEAKRQRKAEKIKRDNEKQRTK